jgi:2-polyprenyl-3-methyl-5-hydroxy-6-metoxy-1,4-benzoquinol methylase
MSSPLSPVTSRSNTALAESFNSEDIITLYRQQLDTDVSEFLPAKGQFQLYECADTGYRFYHPRGMDGDGVFYEQLQLQLGDGYYHPWKFENQLALDEMKAGDKVLDIGCGIGNFLSRATEKASEACGLELNKKALKACRRKGLEVFDELIANHAANRPGYYDMVCMFQVLEHIYDVKTFLEDALKALKPGGKLVIGVPNNEPYFLGYDKYCTLNLPPHHMGLWNRQVFEKMAPLFNLQIQQVQYDVKGSIKTQAYLHAKYLLNIKSIGGKHTAAEKIKMMMAAVYTLPAAVVKKLTTGINGSHIAVVFKKM